MTLMHGIEYEHKWSPGAAAAFDRCMGADFPANAKFADRERHALKRANELVSATDPWAYGMGPRVSRWSCSWVLPNGRRLSWHIALLEAAHRAPPSRSTMERFALKVGSEMRATAIRIECCAIAWPTLERSATPITTEKRCKSLVTKRTKRSGQRFRLRGISAVSAVPNAARQQSTRAFLGIIQRTLCRALHSSVIRRPPPTPCKNKSAQFKCRAAARSRIPRATHTSACEAATR
jgi:hypothetical protein